MLSLKIPKLLWEDTFPISYLFPSIHIGLQKFSNIIYKFLQDRKIKGNVLK